MAQTRLSARELGDGGVTTVDLADLAVTDAKVATANKDGAAAIPSMRTLGVGPLQAVAGNDSRLSDLRAPSAHTHGNISNIGAIGITAGFPIITGASGVLQIGSFGTTAGTFTQGNDLRLSDARTPLAHNQAWSTITDGSTIVATNLATTILTGGGTMSLSSIYEVKWGTRFILISNGNGSHFSTAGYFDIIMPIVGAVITGVGGAGSKTVTAAGIPLASWDVLYYILPIGSGATSIDANFRVVNYNSAFVVPSTWIKVCARAESSYVEFANGISLRPNSSIDSNLYDSLGSDISGPVSSALVLTNARTINGVSFNGSANITITAAASDVSAWAKAAVKPSYTFAEIGTKPTTLSGYGISETPWTGLGYITASASITGAARRIEFIDGPRTLVDRLPNSMRRSVNFDFVNASVLGGTGSYGGVMTFAPWDGNTVSTGDSSYQLAFLNETGTNGTGVPGLKLRKGIDSTWGSWFSLITSGNIASQSVNYANSAGSANATDVYAWAKASVKPSYTKAEVGLSLVDNTADASKSVSSASYASYLPPAYNGAVYTNPQVYFNNTIGLKVAMTAAAGTWSDTLWINGYSGADVPNMCALHFKRDATPRAFISTQANSSATYGTQYELISTYNIASQSVSYATTAGSTTLADKLNPLSGDSNYKLAYTADGQRTNAGEWGRAVMRYEPNGQTYGIRVDRADYADSAGSVTNASNASALFFNSDYSNVERPLVSASNSTQGNASAFINAGVTVNFFNNRITASSFKKSGGTASEYLMADGSVTTGNGGLKIAIYDTSFFKNRQNQQLNTGINYGATIVEIRAVLVCSVANNGYQVNDTASIMNGQYPIDADRTSGQGITIRSTYNMYPTYIGYSIGENLTVGSMTGTVGSSPDNWFFAIESQWFLRFIVYYQ